MRMASWMLCMVEPYRMNLASCVLVWIHAIPDGCVFVDDVHGLYPMPHGYGSYVDVLCGLLGHTTRQRQGCGFGDVLYGLYHIRIWVRGCYVWHIPYHVEMVRGCYICGLNHSTWTWLDCNRYPVAVLSGGIATYMVNTAQTM